MMRIPRKPTILLVTRTRKVLFWMSFLVLSESISHESNQLFDLVSNTILFLLTNRFLSFLNLREYFSIGLCATVDY